MERFARFFCRSRVLVEIGVERCVYIYMVECMWCGQVPRPHALRELRYNPTRPPMSYVTLPTCVCKYFRDVSACTQIQTLTHEHKCFSQRVRDALVTEARDQAFDYVCFTDLLLVFDIVLLHIC